MYFHSYTLHPPPLLPHGSYLKFFVNVRVALNYFRQSSIQRQNLCSKVEGPDIRNWSDKKGGFSCSFEIFCMQKEDQPLPLNDEIKSGSLPSLWNGHSQNQAIKLLLKNLKINRLNNELKHGQWNRKYQVSCRCRTGSICGEESR